MLLLSSLPVFPVTLALDAKAAAIFQCYPRFERGYVEDARRNGLEIYVWLINTVEDLERVRGLGVNGIVTDNPCLFKSR
ncbi:MAG TPA: glycerophosphodiester phosphodiesterase family protein [Desulfobacteria bacterium]|nr:glycerophosphodiester phosphodiesterase family protein [Desulfobacteria bacterium]